MKSIQTPFYEVHFGRYAATTLKTYLEKSNFTKVVVVVDGNTKKHCLPHFLKNNPDLKFEIIEIPVGESHKNIETCLLVWRQLSVLEIDRNSLVINLGGGVVTDLGGFVAATFKRGLKFINIPTSLLAMVDASVGGKTGIDLDHSKNQVGTITFAEMVLIDTLYLETLPKTELRSGMAEMLKHGLISDRNYWNQLKNLRPTDTTKLIPLIYRSVEIKNKIVSKDPIEKDIRKFLNFGHTLGHAIETHCLESQTLKTLLHGEAIAVGMVLEAFLSNTLSSLTASDLEAIKETFSEIYNKVSFELSDIKSIIKLLKDDKKNSRGQVNFVLLETIGQCKYDISVPEAAIFKAFEYYAL